MNIISIGLIGGTGKMGQHIIQRVRVSPTLHLQAVFARQPMPIPEYVSTLTELFEKSQVVIDFSSVDIIRLVLDQAVHSKKPFISGVTGLDSNHYQYLKDAAQSIPIVYDANMSLGIVLLKKAISDITQKLDDSFDRDIVEHHHRYKKDAPSGTSVALAKCLAQNPLLTKEDLHCNPLTNRPKGAIAVSIMHAGGILADQQVHFTSDLEQITLSHHCLNRGVYAEGALKAAQWIIHQPPQLYTMEDVLGLTE